MSFSLDLKEFIEKAKGNVEVVIQKTAIDLLSAVVDRSPVGNPELWASNAVATQYNNEVARLNVEARNNPDNLSKSGRMKPGRLIKDSMDLTAGADYVGGRFRGNWQVSFDTAITGELDRIDPKGSASKGDGSAVIQGFTTEVGTIWMMNNQPYAQALEYGHSTQAPAGMVRISTLEVQQFINKAVSELPK
ncbi:hypothetical protein [Pseudomonas sp.]|uniref:hypothetical protein n=1 Tax=Pseudomonas sp. TaxID=306 RepID=UPI003FD8A222